ncbi:hypothetical protein L9F63_019707, partial [Diploptera punctata]
IKRNCNCSHSYIRCFYFSDGYVNKASPKFTHSQAYILVGSFIKPNNTIHVILDYIAFILRKQIFVFIIIRELILTRKLFNGILKICIMTILDYFYNLSSTFLKLILAFSLTCHRKLYLVCSDFIHATVQGHACFNMLRPVNLHCTVVFFLHHATKVYKSCRNYFCYICVHIRDSFRFIKIQYFNIYKHNSQVHKQVMEITEGTLKTDLLVNFTKSSTACNSSKSELSYVFLVILRSTTSIKGFGKYLFVAANYLSTDWPFRSTRPRYLAIQVLKYMEEWQ